jgi:hypothetical protein
MHTVACSVAYDYKKSPTNWHRLSSTVPNSLTVIFRIFTPAAAAPETTSFFSPRWDRMNDFK